MSIEEIVTNIDARIATLQSDIQPLLDARNALVKRSAAPKPAKRGRRDAQTAHAAAPTTKADPTEPAPKRTPRRTVRRPKVDPVPSGKLITVLAGGDGLTATALAKETGGDANQIRVLLKELADAGQVRKTGERSTTRWHLITDEEQITARGIEIETESRAARTGPASRTRRRTA